jgi:hypothetical protein
MSALSDYLENKLVDCICRGQTYTAPANVFIALHTANPTDTGSGAEVSGGAYARVSVAATLANFSGTQGAGTTAASSGTGGQISNNNAITFTAPSGANWGTVTHFSMRDQITGGNLLMYGVLSTPRTINSGDAAPSFAAGSLQFTLA